MTKKAVVLGRGFLGDYLVKEFSNSDYAVYSTRSTNITKQDIHLDIQDGANVYSVLKKISPDIVLNCIALTDLDFQEKNPDIAYMINADGAKTVAQACKKIGSKLIHISTDGIFDGKKEFYTENDIPHPINIYGKTKLLAEQFVKEESDNYIIARTNFYGYNPNDSNLLNWIVRKLSNNEQITGFSDVYFTPLETTNLSRLIREASERINNQIINLSSDFKISKYEFILKAAEVFNLNKNLVKKGSIDDFGFYALRPKDTSLSNEKSKTLLQTKVVNLDDSLKKAKEFFTIMG